MKIYRGTTRKLLLLLSRIRSYCLQSLAELSSSCVNKFWAIANSFVSYFFSEKKIGFRSFIFFPSNNLSLILEFKFRRIFYTAASIICCPFLFPNMREILTRNCCFTKFSNFHENIAVCRN